MYKLLFFWFVFCILVFFVGFIFVIMVFVCLDIFFDNGLILCWLLVDIVNKYFVFGLRELIVIDWMYCGIWIIFVSLFEREKKISNRNEL